LRATSALKSNSRARDASVKSLPLDQQEVGGVVQPLVGVQDPLEQLLVAAAVAHGPQVVDHRPVGLLVGLGSR
jgi:hypothetical protein